MEVLKTHKTFGGKTQFWIHDSKITHTKMKFSTYIPNGEVKGCLIWLSGLTCTDENFISKAGAQKYLEKEKLMVICPDTSPRGLDLPGEHDSYDFGSGAGFYVNATTKEYKDHYRMYDYVNEELYNIIKTIFKVDKISIFGHSMGGHGALVIGLRNPNKYRSISAFSPIVNPMKCEWGKKAFTGYLGDDQNEWKKFDACELLKSGHRHANPLLIEQGKGDEFYVNGQLLTENIQAAATEAIQHVKLEFQHEFDHSYYFISSFIEKHIQFHTKFLK